MTDGNTYAIDKYLDEREDWDALQEVTAELEQAEARIEELEAKLAKAEAKIVEEDFRMNMIEQIKEDRDKRTQGAWSSDPKFWSEVNAENGLSVLSCWHEQAENQKIRITGVNPVSLEESAANARCAARYPDMEAALIAADELAKAVDFMNESGCQTAVSQLMMCMASFRAAIGAK